MKDQTASAPAPFQALLHASAKLREQKNFQRAIELMESSLGKLDPGCREDAYLQIIFAAEEGGLLEVAHKYRKLLAALSPDTPAIKQR